MNEILMVSRMGFGNLLQTLTVGGELLKRGEKKERNGERREIKKKN